MNISEPAVGSAVRRIEELEKQLAKNEVFKVIQPSLEPLPPSLQTVPHTLEVQLQLGVSAAVWLWLCRLWL